MSLAIIVDKVAAVLIGNKWYPVDNGSFTLDAYEYISKYEHKDGEYWEGEKRFKEKTLLGGGQSGICATGFSFRVNGQEFRGPLTAVQAVKMGHETK